MYLVNRARLAYPIDSAHALLDARRRPRHFEMNHQPAAVVKVQTLAGCVGGQEHTSLAGGERANGGGAFERGQTAMQLTRAESRQTALQHDKSVAILGEDNRRLSSAT